MIGLNGIHLLVLVLICLGWAYWQRPPDDEKDGLDWDKWIN